MPIFYTNQTTTVSPTIWLNWNNWNGGTTSTTSITLDPVWNQWIAVGDGTAFRSTQAAGALSDQERMQRWEEIRKRAARAHERAKETLLSLLNPHQRKEYEQKQCFCVQGSARKVYRIYKGHAGNVKELRHRREQPIVVGETPEDQLWEVASLCCHPPMAIDNLPDEDAMIAQLLALTSDEEAFCRTANRSVLYGNTPVAA